MAVSAATGTATMRLVQTVAIKRIAARRPAHQPHKDGHDANDGESHEDRADYHERMPSPWAAPHVAVAVRRERNGRRSLLLLLGNGWQRRDSEEGERGEMRRGPADRCEHSGGHGTTSRM